MLAIVFHHWPFCIGPHLLLQLGCFWVDITTFCELTYAATVFCTELMFILMVRKECFDASIKTKSISAKKLDCKSLSTKRLVANHMLADSPSKTARNHPLRQSDIFKDSKTLQLAPSKYKCPWSWCQNDGIKASAPRHLGFQQCVILAPLPQTLYFKDASLECLTITKALIFCTAIKEFVGIDIQMYKNTNKNVKIV